MEEDCFLFCRCCRKDKGNAPRQSSEENKPFGKSEESNPSPFVVSLKPSEPLVITTKAKKTKQKSGGKFVVSFVSIMHDTDSDLEPEEDTRSSRADTQQVQVTHSNGDTYWRRRFCVCFLHHFGIFDRRKANLLPLIGNFFIKFLAWTFPKWRYASTILV